MATQRVLGPGRQQRLKLVPQFVGYSPAVVLLEHPHGAHHLLLEQPITEAIFFPTYRDRLLRARPLKQRDRNEQIAICS
jgi:hypothetical protein